MRLRVFAVALKTTPNEKKDQRKKKTSVHLSRELKGHNLWIRKIQLPLSVDTRETCKIKHINRIFMGQLGFVSWDKSQMCIFLKTGEDFILSTFEGFLFNGLRFEARRCDVLSLKKHE